MSLKATLNAAGAMSIAISLLYSQSPTPPAVPTGTLTGTVRDQTRKVAIGGAKVQVLNAAGAVRGGARHRSGDQAARRASPRRASQ
jgi:type 1 fimbria pilin